MRKFHVNWLAGLALFMSSATVVLAQNHTAMDLDVGALCQPIIREHESLGASAVDLPLLSGLDATCLAQRSLIHIGYLTPDTTIDGFVGMATSMAVEEFQANFGLAAFGIVTQETLVALAEVERELAQPSPTQSEDVQSETAEATENSLNGAVGADETVAANHVNCVAPVVVSNTPGYSRLLSRLPQPCHRHAQWQLDGFEVAADWFVLDGLKQQNLTDASTVTPTQTRDRVLVHLAPKGQGPRFGLSVATLSAQAASSQSDLLVVRVSEDLPSLAQGARCRVLNAGVTSALSQVGFTTEHTSALVQIDRESAIGFLGLEANEVGNVLTIIVDEPSDSGGFMPVERAQIARLGIPVLELGPSNLQAGACTLFAGLTGGFADGRLYSAFDPVSAGQMPQRISDALEAAQTNLDQQPPKALDEPLEPELVPLPAPQLVPLAVQATVAPAEQPIKLDADQENQEPVEISDELARTISGVNRRSVTPQGVNADADADADVEGVDIAPSLAALEAPLTDADNTTANGTARPSSGSNAATALLEPLVATADPVLGLNGRYNPGQIPKGLELPQARLAQLPLAAWVILPDIRAWEFQENDNPMVWHPILNYAYPYDPLSQRYLNPTYTQAIDAQPQPQPQGQAQPQPQGQGQVQRQVQVLPTVQGQTFYGQAGVQPSNTPLFNEFGQPIASPDIQPGLNIVVTPSVPQTGAPQSVIPQNDYPQANLEELGLGGSSFR